MVLSVFHFLPNLKKSVVFFDFLIEFPMDFDQKIDLFSCVFFLVQNTVSIFFAMFLLFSIFFYPESSNGMSKHRSRVPKKKTKKKDTNFGICNRPHLFTMEFYTTSITPTIIMSFTMTT